jgi:hypothetical protein
LSHDLAEAITWALVRWNHANFIPLERYFDEEDDGIGFKGWKLLHFSSKIKISVSFIFNGAAWQLNFTSSYLEIRGNRFGKILYRWKYKMMKITYEVISMAEKLTITSIKLKYSLPLLMGN